MAHIFKTGVSPAFAFPTEKVIHEARFFDHTGDCKMTHTFKTGDTGLTRSGKCSFIIIMDNLKNERPLVVRFTELASGDEFVGNRYSNGRFILADESALDLMPPEPKVIGSVWCVLHWDPDMQIMVPNGPYVLSYLHALAEAKICLIATIARFDTYDDPEHTVKVEVEKV